MGTPTSARSDYAILVVDDEPDLRTLYELTLLREGYQVETAGTLGEAWAHMRQRQFDAVITDMRLPDGLGLQLLLDVGNESRSERCIVMTAYGSAENAVESLKAGAFDYLTKPVDLKQFRSIVASAVQAPKSSRAITGNGSSAVPASVAAHAPAGLAALHRLVGDSEPMRTVKARIAKIARSMAPVLVQGESGTGKELVASAIHACSHRAAGPFIAVNCGAIPENLLEAEFFGAKKGSYTGATQDRDGYFQAARNGTLFLDEIGDLPLAMQSKLLRAIQERRVRALGSIVEEAADVRVISATHKDLATDVQQGKFRQDLYYRLNVIQIALPPLRERRADLPGLCSALLAKIAREVGTVAPAVSPRLLAQLEQHPLRGNVRELENLLHRALALNEGNEFELDTLNDGTGDLPEASATESGRAVVALRAAPPPIEAPSLPSGSVPEDLQAYLDTQEREILVKVLEETQFNRTAAAARLKLSLRQIRYRIARLNIPMPSGADESSNDVA